MNRDLPIIPTLVFIASLILCIGIYMQRVASFSMPVVSQIYEQFGDLNILFKNRIINLEQEFKNASLQQLGVDYHMGQMGLSADETLIINTGGQSTSLWHKWSRFMRKKEHPASDGTSSLLNCLNGLICEPWGDKALQFDTAWSMTDIGKNKFIINDTARHQIHLVDVGGALLDTLPGLSFPNHVFEYQQAYWVVNTNAKSFVELKIGENTVERTGREISLESYQGIPAPYAFSSIAYSHSNGPIFTLLHPNGMNQGRVYRLQNSTATQLFEHLKDITTIYISGDKLYVADYETQSIWFQDVATGESQALHSRSFENAIGQTKANIDTEWRHFLVLISLILGIGLLALVFSLMKSKPVKNSQIAVFSNGAEPVDTGAEVRWVEFDSRYLKQMQLATKFIKIQNTLIPAILVLVFVGVLFRTGVSAANLPILGLMVLYCALVLLIIWFVTVELKKQHYKKLGWDGEHLHLITRQNQAKCLPAEVFYSNYMLYSKGIELPVQFFNRRFFDKNSFEKLISPTMIKENKMSPVKLFILRLNDRAPDARRDMIMALLFPIFLLFFLFVR